MNNILEIIKNYFLNKKINQKDQLEYWANDPTTNIKAKHNYGEKLLPFMVNGYYGGGFPQDSYKGRAANCYATIDVCLNNIESNLKNFPSSWADTKNLNIYPLAGMDLNAYYDRKNIKFFYYFDYTLRKNIYLCESSDVVSHELGHAILDAIRPDFWNVQSYEIWALHESFGDIIAILNILYNKDILKLIIKETNGDLSQSNTVSRMAEHFAKTIYNVTNGKYGASPNSLRDAVNTFEYIDPIKLPDDSDYDKISRECHSFSRIWTGCWYDIFVGIYNLERQNRSTINAIKKARDISAKYFIEATLDVPCTNKIFDALAQKMMQIDGKNNKKYNEILKDIFYKRKILSTNLNNLSVQNLILSEDKTKKIQIKSSKIKNLSNCYVEIPFENKYELDNDGQISILAISDLDESTEIAISCLNSLQNTNMIKKLFKIERKNITRQKIIN
jgi:hypothetical protein